MKTVGKIVLGIIIAMVLLVGGCTVLVGGALDEAAEEIEASQTEEEANDTPSTVAEGDAFTHDYMEVAAGWKVAKEEFSDGVTITGLTMTSTSEERQNPMLAFKFYKGSEVLGEVDCSANEVEAGETSGFDCYSLDEVVPGSWDEIRVADRW